MHIAGPGIEPGTSSSSVRRTTDCATRPGVRKFKANTNKVIDYHEKLCLI